MQKKIAVSVFLICLFLCEFWRLNKIYASPYVPTSKITAASQLLIKRTVIIPAECLPANAGGIPDIDCWIKHNPKIESNLLWEESPSNFSNFVVWKWLQGSPKIVDWNKWPEQLKSSLRDNYKTYWNWLNNKLQGDDPSPMQDPPANQATLKDEDYPYEILSPNDAWQMYVKSVALSLALETSGWFQWSILDYDDTQLQALFDSRKIFRWEDEETLSTGTVLPKGYRMEWDVVGWTLPAPPMKALRFLMDQQIIGFTRKATIVKLLWLSGDLSHFFGDVTARGFDGNWHYRGLVPASRIIDGTTVDPSMVENLDVGSIPSGHITAGCWGTTGFLKFMLKAVNIPVELTQIADHATPHFMSEHLYLSHGDDPYASSMDADPPISTELLMIDGWTFNYWFNPSAPAPACISQLPINSASSSSNSNQDTNFGVNPICTASANPYPDILNCTNDSGSLNGELAAGGSCPNLTAACEGTPDLNVGRRVEELSLQYLSNNLLYDYCQAIKPSPDQADSGSNVPTLSNSEIATDYFRNYTLSELESTCLWERLKAKVQSFGGCGSAQFPPEFHQPRWKESKTWKIMKQRDWRTLKLPPMSILRN